MSIESAMAAMSMPSSAPMSSGVLAKVTRGEVRLPGGSMWSSAWMKGSAMRLAVSWAMLGLQPGLGWLACSGEEASGGAGE